jgi:CheY-specific phosphatase CheX
MSKPLEEALFETAVRTFEDLAFMFPFPEPDGGDPADSVPMAGVSVSFRGSISGRLELRVCERLLPAIAANMLGEEDRATPAQQLDALGEIANVVCGNVLPAITNATEIFHLDAPREITGEAVRKVDNNADAFVRLSLDEGCASLRLILSKSDPK